MQMHPTRSWSRRIAAAVLVISAMVAIPALSACSSDTPPSSSASPATGQHVAASDFSTAIKEPGTIVLDVRTPAEYASGHLPAAQNIDIEAQTSHHGSAHSTRTRPLPCTAAAGTGRAPC